MATPAVAALAVVAATGAAAFGAAARAARGVRRAARGAGVMGAAPAACQVAGIACLLRLPLAAAAASGPVTGAGCPERQGTCAQCERNRADDGCQLPTVLHFLALRPSW